MVTTYYLERGDYKKTKNKKNYTILEHPLNSMLCYVLSII